MKGSGVNIDFVISKMTRLCVKINLIYCIKWYFGLRSGLPRPEAKLGAWTDQTEGQNVKLVLVTTSQQLNALQLT